MVWKTLFPLLILLTGLKSHAQDLLVLCAPGSTPSSQAGEQYRRQISKNANVWALQFCSESSRDAALSAYKRQPGVLIAEKEVQLHLAGGCFPNDTPNWTLHNTGQSGGTPDADMDAPEAWCITKGGITALGDTVVVAIIDHGFDLFGGEVDFWVNHGEIPGNGVDDDGNGYVDDRHGWDAVKQTNISPLREHATIVSRSVAEKGNDGVGGTGLMWYGKVMAIDVGDIVCPLAQVIEAYDYLLTQRKLYNQSGGKKGAYVVSTNNSINTNDGGGEIWNALMDTLGHYGILSAGATQNFFVNIDEVGDLPTQLPSDFQITVTVSNDRDSMGNTGYGVKTIDLAAPSFLGFTSFATPYAAATIALMHTSACADFEQYYKANPAEAALKMKQLLLESVDMKPGFYDLLLTEGRLNAWRALRNFRNHFCNDKLPPVANIKVQGKVSCVGLPVRLEAITHGTNETYRWQVEGGSPLTSNAKSFTTQFNQPGSYDVRLITTSPNGADTVFLPDYIRIVDGFSGGQSTPLLADFEPGNTTQVNIFNPDQDNVYWYINTYDTCHYYAIIINNHDELIFNKVDDFSIAVDLSPLKNATLSFAHAYAGWSQDNEDRLQIWVESCGTQELLYDKVGKELETTQVSNPFAPFVPTQCSDWGNDTLDLAAFTGRQINLIFRNIGRFGNFLYVDDIAVNGEKINTAVATHKAPVLALAPNPASETFYITGIPTSSVIDAVILDISGRIVKTFKGIPATAIPVQDLAPGAYRVQVLHQQQVYQMPLLLQKF